jgi:DNA polymerase delta subunit 3
MHQITSPVNHLSGGQLLPASAMDSRYRTYLATQIYSEQATVSYRNTARALKVHVNAAKRILYEFHSHENRKKPNSVHATYLLAGKKKSNEQPVATNEAIDRTEADDEAIPSSPPPFTSSMLQSSQQEVDCQQGQTEILPAKTVTLVREESLEGLSCPCTP